MPHITIEECIKCKFTDCVNVCPVDCFHEGLNFLVINPEICIDCAVCIPECPIEAIIESNNTNSLLEIINFSFSKLWPKKILSDNNYQKNLKWKNIKNKLHLINL